MVVKFHVISIMVLFVIGFWSIRNPCDRAFKISSDLEDWAQMLLGRMQCSGLQTTSDLLCVTWIAKLGTAVTCLWPVWSKTLHYSWQSCSMTTGPSDIRYMGYLSRLRPSGSSACKKRGTHASFGWWIWSKVLLPIYKTSYRISCFELRSACLCAWKKETFDGTGSECIIARVQGFMPVTNDSCGIWIWWK